MISDIFIVNGAAQCADVPLAYFFLAAVVCVFMYFKKNSFSYLTLGMIFAALSIWVKNEGMMFFVVYMAVLLGYFLYSKKYKNALVYGLATLPVIFLTVLYKKFTASPNDLITGFFLFKTWHFVFDFQRYWIIIKTFLSMTFLRFTIFFVLLFLTIKGFKIRPKNKDAFILSLIIFGLMVVGYFCVYLFSPHDVQWLVDNSMDRIMIQILPIFLFLFSINLRIGKPDTMN